MWYPDPDDLYSDDLLMQLWWRRSRAARIDIELEISRIVDEHGWASDDDDADSNGELPEDENQGDEEG